MAFGYDVIGREQIFDLQQHFGIRPERGVHWTFISFIAG